MEQKKLEKLVREMTLEEKAAQLTQIPLSAITGDPGDPTGPAAKYHLSREQLSICGSLICDQTPDAKTYAGVVRAMTDAQPHHIPPILMRDIIHGFQTVFPIPLALGCSFDPELAREMGSISAAEGKASGIHATFAPMVDVVRDPRWGRVMESPGESPKLCGAMGAAMVRGIHQENMAACIKHFAGYGLCQAGMEYAPADCSRAEMYNVYFPPFKETLDAGCDMIMPSFIGVDRVPCVCSEWLLKKILRDRWHSDAMAISDYADIKQLKNHGIAADNKEAAEICINAGLDMDMMSFAYLQYLPELVREGKVSEDAVNSAVLRVLKLKNKVGLLENPVYNEDTGAQQAAMGKEEFRKAALRAVQESCVLLKNDGVLPLKAGQKVALVGDHADTGCILGGWSLDGVPAETETVLQALSKETRITLTPPVNADVILFAVGEDEYETGEGGSKTKPWLTTAQMEELERLRKIGKPICMLLFCGRPLILTDVLPKCDALLNVWFPGTAGAEGIRSLVMGDSNPSGHLSMTFPRSLGQVPIHHDKLTSCRKHLANDRYSNRYVDEENDPLFPFGFGLSYTSFALSEQSIAGDAVSARVTNTGACYGETVVQLYGRVLRGHLIRAEKTLLGWKRVGLKPGESTVVTISAQKELLTVYDAEGTAFPPKGGCAFGIGFDSSVPLDLVGEETGDKSPG